MRLNRVAWGAVAGTVGVCAAFAASALAVRLIDLLEPQSLGEYAPAQQVFWIVFVIVGGGVFWLADWLGVVSSPYERSTSLVERGDADEPTRGGVSPPDFGDL